MNPLKLMRLILIPVRFANFLVFTAIYLAFNRP